MPSAEKLEKKRQYFDKLLELVQNYPQVLIVGVDNVGSKQMAEIRIALRGKAVILMGKNTMIRTGLRQKTAELPELEKLVNVVKGNVGFVFCKSDPSEVRGIILANRVPAPARQGLIAPVEVVIPGGATGLDPSQTSFFQALGIPTKIVKGQIEIQGDVPLIAKSEKVNASQSVLLQKLNIRPFSYGLNVKQIYDDGSVYSASVLDMVDDVILERFSVGVQNVAAMSRALGLPTAASIPHSILEAFKFCAALVIDSDFSFPQMEPIREYLKDPSAFAAAAAPAAAAQRTAPAAAAAAAKEEEEEEEDDDMGFGLFD